ncbi:hypothetical protein V8E36_004858 [Tilletia maclaganii]
MFCPPRPACTPAHGCRQNGSGRATMEETECATPGARPPQQSHARRRKAIMSGVLPHLGRLGAHSTQSCSGSCLALTPRASLHSWNAAFSTAAAIKTTTQLLTSPSRPQELPSTRFAARSAASSHIVGAYTSRRAYAAKARKGKNKRNDDDDVDYENDPNADYNDDVPVINTRGKGAKGAKSKPHGAKSKHGGHGSREHEALDSGDGIATSTRNQDLPGEKFDLAQLSANMQRAVKRCRETISGMVGMMGRPDPAILDSVRVPLATGNEGNKGESIEKSSHPLLELASVGVRDGSLWVTCYDPDTVKQVERGIYLAELGLTPQVIQNEDEAVIKIPIPKPNAETRAKLLKYIARICENARVSIRAARHQGQKDLSADQKKKIVGSEEARKEGKKLDEETKNHTASVDKLLEEMKQKVETAS